MIIELIQSFAILLYMTALIYIKEIAIIFAITIVAYAAFYITMNKKNQNKKIETKK